MVGKKQPFAGLPYSAMLEMKHSMLFLPLRGSQDVVLMTSWSSAGSRGAAVFMLKMYTDDVNVLKLNSTHVWSFDPSSLYYKSSDVSLEVLVNRRPIETKRSFE